MKVNLFEFLLVVIAIMWAAGYFRRLYSSGNQSSMNHNHQNNPVPPQNNPSHPSKKSKYGDDGEFVDYEEIK